jgi:lipoate-protein ligase B
MTRAVDLFHLGLVDYETAMAWQRLRAARLRAAAAPEAVALLQHPPVYTLGRRARADSLRLPRAALEAVGAPVVDTDRGGDVTFHGPGQLVLYAVLDLRARRLLPGDHVRRLEEVSIRAIAPFGVVGERVPGRPGVWAGGGKLASVGVRVADGVSTHGLALNVSTDLSRFEAILPCGLPDVRVTSLQRLLCRDVLVEDVEAAVSEAFESVFACRLAPSTSDRPEPSISRGP